MAEVKKHRRMFDFNLKGIKWPKPASLKKSKEDKKVEAKSHSKTKMSNGKGLFKGLRSISFTRLSIKDQTFFAKRLSFLIKAGVPMRESLVMIREQTTKKGYVAILDAVIHDVSNGQNLSTSMGKFKNVFGEFTINIIGFGEETGVLSENLEYVADELKKRQLIRKKIIGAAVYPIIVSLATFGIVIFLMVFLFPKILPIFSSLHYELPLSTRIVIAISNFFRHYGLMAISAFAVLLIAFLIILKKLESVRFHFDRLLLRIPIIGKIVQDYNMANFSRTMGLLLRGGISMGDAIPVAVKITPNLAYKNEYKALAGIVNRGSKLSVHLSKNRKLFPDIVTQIVSVGESSGNLSNSLIYLSEMYEAEIDDFTKNLSNMVEPMLMIIMGMLVGFIAISIITPIYGITQHLNVR